MRAGHLAVTVVAALAAGAGAQVERPLPPLGSLAFDATDQIDRLRRFALEVGEMRITAPDAVRDGSAFVLPLGTLRLPAQLPGRVAFDGLARDGTSQVLRNLSVSLEGIVLVAPVAETRDGALARGATFTLHEATLTIPRQVERRLVRQIRIPSALLTDVPAATR